MRIERAKRVAFADESLQLAFRRLQKGRFEEKRLAENITHAMRVLMGNPFAGLPIRRMLWPREYVAQFGIDNLRKYNLPDGWRLLYTIHGDEVEIVSVILEWCNHKDYEKRFGYKVG